MTHLRARHQDRFETLVGAHFGVIEQMAAVPAESDDLPIRVFAGTLANTAAIGRSQAGPAVSGAALREDRALAACLGEGMERYAASLSDPELIGAVRAADLTGRVVTPEQFALFGRIQYARRSARFPFVRWRPEDRLAWTVARSLSKEELVHVPAQFVYLPWRCFDGEPELTPGLSTGLACGEDLEQATVSGLCEVLERDAVALAWLGRISPPRISTGVTGDGELGELLVLLHRSGHRFGLFDLTTEFGVPIAAAILEGESPVGRIVSFGSACGLDAAKVASKAIVEASHCRMYVKSLVRQDPVWSGGERFERVTSFADHARFYTAHSEHRHVFDRWWNSPHSTRISDFVSRSVDDDARPVNVLSRRIQLAGFEPIVADLTPPDLADIGVTVIRAIVPGLQPLHGNHAWAHHGGARLRRLRQVFPGAPAMSFRWNRYPHPGA